MTVTNHLHINRDLFSVQRSPYIYTYNTSHTHQSLHTNHLGNRGNSFINRALASTTSAADKTIPTPRAPNDLAMLQSVYIQYEYMCIYIYNVLIILDVWIYICIWGFFIRWMFAIHLDFKTFLPVHIDSNLLFCGVVSCRRKHYDANTNVWCIAGLFFKLYLG